MLVQQFWLWPCTNDPDTVAQIWPTGQSLTTGAVLAAVQVKREVGDVNILVNNAGIVTGKKFMDAPDSLVEKTMEVNTQAHFWVS